MLRKVMMALCMLVSAGCAVNEVQPTPLVTEQAETENTPETVIGTEAAEDMVIPVKEFTQESLPVLLEGNGNKVVSPLNIWLALGMLSETAEGSTRAELTRLLHTEDTVEAVKALRAVHNRESEDGTEVNGAAIWLSDAYMYDRDVLQRLQDPYTKIADVTMGRPETDKQIRDWVNELTRGMLEESTESIQTEQLTVMELLTTLYYKSFWLDRFNEDKTYDSVFHGTDGDMDVRMMYREGSREIYSGEKWQAISLYTADRGVMWLVLPEEGVDPAELAGDAQLQHLMDEPYTYENSEYVIVKASVPKFRVQCDTDLKEILPKLGVQEAFDPQKASFILTDDTQLYLSSAKHAAVLEIDEDGVCGAAYTELGLAGAGMPPQIVREFVLDRPFFFAMTAGDGTILFAGTVRNVE